jgi:serine/threonine protein kinase
MLTNTGVLSYKAPEMLECTIYDERIDIWSIGIIAYHCVSGKFPFEHKNILDTIDLILKA